MENPSPVFAGAMRDASPSDRASQLPEDLLLMGMPPVNLLLTGREGVIRTVLDTLLGARHEPIARWHPGERLVLPPLGRSGTMILHDVDALGYEDQLHLLEWLEQRRGARAQVVSTTRAPLMPLVEKGAFSDLLYYRLNTVSVEVHG